MEQLKTFGIKGGGGQRKYNTQICPASFLLILSPSAQYGPTVNWDALVVKIFQVVNTGG